MLTVFADLHRREEEMAALEQQMAEAYSPELLESYGQAQAQFEAGGGYQYQNDIKRVLLGLGFPPVSYTHLRAGRRRRTGCRRGRSRYYTRPS